MKWQKNRTKISQRWLPILPNNLKNFLFSSLWKGQKKKNQSLTNDLIFLIKHKRLSKQNLIRQFANVICFQCHLSKKQLQTFITHLNTQTLQDTLEFYLGDKTRGFEDSQSIKKIGSILIDNFFHFVLDFIPFFNIIGSHKSFNNGLHYFPFIFI